MNAFRVRHLENFLTLYTTPSGAALPSGGSAPRASPLAEKLRAYVGSHGKKIAAGDRHWLWLHASEIVRWRRLLEATTIGKQDWSHILGTYFRNAHWRKAAQDGKLALPVRLSVPEELHGKLEQQFGAAKTEKICKVYNEGTDGKVFLRANLLRSSRDALHKKLLGHKLAVEKSAYTETGLVLGSATRLKEIPEFAHGLFDIQDDASQLKARQVKARAGEVVVEICAGNGGRALVYGAKMENMGHMFLHDVSFDNARTASTVKRRLVTAGLRNFTLLDTHALAKQKLTNKAQWVVLDAPSTGSAVFRKSPELKYGFSEERLRGLVEKQRSLFEQALRFVHKRGKIVYMTSSLFQEENSLQVEFFCTKFNLELVEEPMFILPQSHGMNGLFVAVMQRPQKASAP